MSQLDFNEQMAAELEAVYSKPDIRRRRALVHEALAAAPGERVLDAGCGPGFYVAETLERVGPEGSVVGVDASAPMLALAAKRCEGHDNVSFHEGDVDGPAGGGRRLRPRPVGPGARVRSRTSRPPSASCTACCGPAAGC